MTDTTPPDIVDAILRAQLAKCDPLHPGVMLRERIGAWFVHGGKFYFVDHGLPYVEAAADYLRKLEPSK